MHSLYQALDQGLDMRYLTSFIEGQIILILQMRKLTLRDVRFFAQGQIDGNRDKMPMFLVTRLSAFIVPTNHTKK